MIDVRSDSAVFGRSRLSGQLITSSGAVVQYLPRSDGAVFGRSRLSGQLLTSSGVVVFLARIVVRNFLRALHLNGAQKSRAIEEIKESTTLSLARIIGNLKARKESSNEVVQPPLVKMRLRHGRKNTSRNSSKDKAFVGESWSDSNDDEEEKTKDEKCLMAKDSNEGPYSTDPPTPDDILRLLELERVMVDRTIKSQIVTLTINQILTKELSPDIKQWEELIRENVGLNTFLLTSLSRELMCRAIQPQSFPYGMFLTCLYRHIMEAYPHLDNGIYDIVDRVMRPLALKQTRRTQIDRGKARHSVSSSSSHRQGTSSHQHDDDDNDDVETSRASTPSPTTYLNSLDPLNYQNYQMPSSSEQTDETLFEWQTDLLNQT
ncbi:hypothetical protein Tco_0506134 [Tanacetum coccineum]